jgi:hypothetical protein
MERPCVHTTRRGGQVVQVTVTRVGLHQYESPHNAIQGETAIYAHLPNRHGKWYVGYGADYVPATKTDIANISNVRSGNW